jgi:hypothetical protein
MTRGIWLLVLSLFVFAVVVTTVANAVEQTGYLNTNTSDSTVDSNNKSTTNNYNGAGAASKVTPPPSAIAPSYISNGQDTCLVGSSIGTQVNVFGLSGGFYRQDINCNRRRDAKVLKDLGMNIAAVALMCKDTDVWLSMFQSGTPCPITINGRLLVGRAAYYTMKKDPGLFIPEYKKNKEYYDLTLRLEQTDEETTDSGLSISERFRTSIRRD